MFVKVNNYYLDLAKKALNLIDSKDFDYVSVRPRNILEILVIVVRTEKRNKKN